MSQTATNLQLTEEQKNVLLSIVYGIKKQQLPQVTLGGLAGTGKTTLIKFLPKFFPNFAICAFTGKAANVLRKKGLLTSSTIHSLIYQPVYENGMLLGFELKDALESEGIIIDEASMVSKDIYTDLKDFGLPMIFVGDHGQLEPVGTDFNLMKKPNFKLETIHRNAGDIAKFAERLRLGYKATSFPESEKVQFLKAQYLGDDDLLSVDQVICAYNKTRIEINNRIRAAMGYTGVINVGERVMCLKNNKRLSLFNGMQGIVRRLYKEKGQHYMDFEFDGDVLFGIKYDRTAFGKERIENDYFGQDYPNPFDYAYCITCHKSQGDEFEKTLVIEQKCKAWDPRRWNYTAASRAKETVKWAFE